MNKFFTWWKSGAPYIWLNAGAVSISLVVVVGLILMIAAKGMGHFWLSDIVALDYRTSALEDSTKLVGEITGTELVDAEQYLDSLSPEIKAKAMEKIGDARTVERWLLKTGNREILGRDFRWLDSFWVTNMQKPKDLLMIERVEWGNLYGTLQSVQQAGAQVSSQASRWEEFQTRLQRVDDLRDDIRELEKGEMSAISFKLEKLRLKGKRLALENKNTPEALKQLDQQEQALYAEYAVYRKELADLYQQAARDSVVIEVMDGQRVTLSMDKIVAAYLPNQMSVLEKLYHYILRFIDFIVADPREANTEGGIFPALFGTVLMVLLMSVIVTPFGVISAIYLREYASQGVMTRLVRIAVNNLAGVPSIVYGVFGLGFFVYFLGGSLDALFYPEAAPAPVFGTPGILWASLTLALLTVPVVIVSTEEGLSRVPRSLREGSLALGATKAETLWKVVLPMVGPSIMTGLILAVARAAGEVAPLMLVGVVKLAPELPMDGNFPFMHLDRKFMHLGFHIYDVGFQSPNVEAARPLVYATSFLLVLVIIILNLSAIVLRNRLREKFKGMEH
ncbi:MAG TPA: phosphate ABC transporter permease PstA [Pseudomonadales bacterium]